MINLVKFIIFFIRIIKVKKYNKEARRLLKEKYTEKYLLKRSFLIENLLCKKNKELAVEIGIDEIWINNLNKKKRKIDFKRVLNYASDKGLFECFKISLKKNKYGKLFINWIDKNGDISNLQKLAIQSNGQDFDRKSGFIILKSKLNEIRELLGSFEWFVRLFAVKILLLDDNDISTRLMWDMMRDSHHIIRKLVVNEYMPIDKEKHYNELYKLLTEDPVFEVRKACWEKIHSIYPDYFKINQRCLNDKEALYILQLLRGESKQDENIALYYLVDNNLELRYAAANYLDKSGCLYRLIYEVDLGDKEALNRNYELLKKASEVNVTSFLRCVGETNNPASLLIAARILLNKGDVYYITILAKKVFYLYRGEKDYQELYEKTLECVSTRGNERALRLYNYEINKRRDSEIIESVLSYFPTRNENIFIDTLFDLLIDNYFKYEESLYNAFSKIPAYIILPIVFEIINDDTQRYLHEIKVRAIKLLGKIKMHYCLQSVLENLNLMSINEANEFASVLKEYPAALFNKKVEDLANSIDSRIRASIISVLPATKNRDFIKLVQKGLKDVDPDVRIASMNAIVDFEEYKALVDITDMLFDPVERVRVEAGIILSKSGNKNILKTLEKILNDPNEIVEIKKAIITGLGHSKLIDSIELIIKALEVHEELYENAIISLSGHTEKNEIKKIIEYFKEASPRLKESIVKVFTIMKETAESMLCELLKDENPNVNPYIAEILEKTGYIDKLIKNINNKDSQIRKNAVEILSLIGTTKSYRGVVIAAFDPDNEIRIKVIKALEKLDNDDSKKILNELKSDPDKKVRKYTLWALERLRTKEI
jgi:HEAT repeat protein